MTEDTTTAEIKPIVGEGHPLDPNRGKLLSHDDERRIDEKGRPVVDGKLWGDAHTDMWLVVNMHVAPYYPDRLVVGRTEIALGEAFGGAGSTKLSIAVSKKGKPVFMHEIVGGCLELPDDLGSDAAKRQYVIEWLLGTVFECFEVRQIALPDKKSQTMQDFGMALAAAAQKAIEGSGL